MDFSHLWELDSLKKESQAQTKSDFYTDALEALGGTDLQEDSYDEDLNTDEAIAQSLEEEWKKAESKKDKKARKDARKERKDSFCAGLTPKKILGKIGLGGQDSPSSQTTSSSEGGSQNSNRYLPTIR